MSSHQLKQLGKALSAPAGLYVLGNVFGFALEQDLYKVYPHLDTVMHALGGAAIAYSGWLLVERYWWAGSSFPSFAPAVRQLFLIGIVSLAIILWELYEYGLQGLGIIADPITYTDTVADMAIGLLGGTIVSAYLVRRSSRAR